MATNNMFAAIDDSGDEVTSLTTEDRTMIEKAIETGPWTLYFHDLRDDWKELATYKKVGRFEKYGDIIPVWDALSDETLLNGHFFMMRGSAPPMWERSENIYGGTYSMVVPRSEAADVYRTYVYAAITGALAKDPANKIMGVCISKKYQSNLITIWNANADKFNDPIADINVYNRIDGQLMYKANASKNYDKTTYKSGGGGGGGGGAGGGGGGRR